MARAAALGLLLAELAALPSANFAHRAGVVARRPEAGVAAAASAVWPCHPRGPVEEASLLPEAGLPAVPNLAHPARVVGPAAGRPVAGLAPPSAAWGPPVGP